MARVQWPLVHGTPVIEIQLETHAGLIWSRTLLADTGAGSSRSGLDLILKDRDCRNCGVALGVDIQLTGAFVGMYPMFGVRVQIPAIRFDDIVQAAAVSQVSDHGIAGFCFLNRFTYGNFGNPDAFGLES